MNDNGNKSIARDNSNVPGDPPVYYTQVWLNQTYGSNPNWVPLSEDGITGWGTITGLIRALQIYLGTGVDGDFGPTTASAFESRFRNTDGCVVPVLYEVDNVYGMIAGALWCKGYYGSWEYEINCQIDERGSTSIFNLKRDAGLSTNNNHIDVNLMKALLSMDQFVILESYGGTAEIRSIQQYLNANHGDYIGIIPCDGLYSRQMNTALIKVLQLVIGFYGSDVDGILGDGTKRLLPQLSASNQPEAAVRLFNFCLTCNGFTNSGTTWTSEVTAKTTSFQRKYMIPETGIGDTNTWMSLLLSKGNPDRSALGCDCATILDAQKSNALYEAGYRYVGRYISGTVGVGDNERSKALTKSEMQAIFSSGLSLFAIYQEGGVYLERYTYDRGLEDAEKAMAAALALNIPTREYIYFAVDYDIMDGYIEPYVVPYFTAINEVIGGHGNKYHVGIYGARNVCSKICFKYGLASSSFVSDMSTGYSGNMGYQIPDNWAFDQFHEFTFSGSGVSFPLDKVAVSGRYSGFNFFGDDQEDSEDIDEEEMLDTVYEMLTSVLPAEDDEGGGFVPPRTSISWSNPMFSLTVGPVTIKASWKHSSLFNISEDNAQYGTYSISNQEFRGATWSHTEELYDSLDAAMKAEIDFEDGWSYIFDLARAVGNGKINVGVKASGLNEITLYIVAERYLATTATTRHSVSVKIELIVKNESGDGQSFDFQHVFEEALAAVDMILATVVIIGKAAVQMVVTALKIGGTILVGIIMTLFLALFGWLLA